MTQRPAYDCDTFGYWCSDADYVDRDRVFGRFVEDGAAYQIEDPHTPRPWLNYFANRDFGSVLANDGKGFTWFRSTLLRITKYEHPVDYLPREFVDGRKVVFVPDDGSDPIHLLPTRERITCTHRPGSSTLSVQRTELALDFTLFVPPEDNCEIWLLDVRNTGTKPLRGLLLMEQVWSIATFGIHTAEEGIPYVSTPGKDLQITRDKHGVYAESRDPMLPYPIAAGFFSAGADHAECMPVTGKRPDGRVFTFHRCRLGQALALQPGESVQLEVVSAAERNRAALDALRQRLLVPGAGRELLEVVRRQWQDWLAAPACRIPAPDLQNFLNVWLKNQLHLTFFFVRSGHNGYRDSLQDAWGYTLIDPARARTRLLQILAHQHADGTAPRNFSNFDDGKHDLRNFMDSPVWIARTLVDLVKETGDAALLDVEVPFLDGGAGTVAEHAWRALDVLYARRGQHGFCLTGEGDWNDALEGISKDGDAVSVWLTMALFDAMQHMLELYAYTQNTARAEILRQRAEEIRRCIEEKAWDGAWYVYGFTGRGQPIGSARNREGRIHLNAQTWAVFSRLAGPERARTAMDSVRSYLDTPIGPALLAPPYVHEAAEVGRIARLEPGTFENGAVYQHAVTFKILADIALGDGASAYDTFRRTLPTNPENLDARRTSEPYCTGNFYCGPGHPRFGQNFFSWFTGNSAWLMRIGYDYLLGVRPDFAGLRLQPCVPSDWNEYDVKRRYRGCDYHIHFKRRAAPDQPRRLTVDGREVAGDVIPPQAKSACEVEFVF
jgi:cellobiose phosphorylase